LTWQFRSDIRKDNEMKKKKKKLQIIAKAQKKHAKKRIENRFGLDMNDNKLTQIINKIIKGSAELIKKHSNHRSEWKVPFEEKILRVIYDNKTKSIVTALPLNDYWSVEKTAEEVINCKPKQGGRKMNNTNSSNSMMDGSARNLTNQKMLYSVDELDFREDLFSSLPDFETGWMPIDLFQTIPDFPQNRATEPRVKYVSQMLAREALVNHLIVQIVEYPSGDMYTINGNTREKLWRRGMAPKPDYVFAIIIKLTDDTIANSEHYRKAQSEYYSIDSEDSVENGKDKFTGAFAKLNMNMRSSKLKGGGISLGVKHFLQIWPDLDVPKSAGKRGERNNDFFVKATALLREEILTVDGILADLAEDKNSDSDALKNTNFMTLSFCFLKKYGCDNQKVIEGIRKIYKGYINWPSRTTDGISHITYELRNTNSRWIPDKRTEGNLRSQMDFLFSCFQKYMDDEEMNSARSYGKDNSPYANFFVGFEIQEIVIRRRRAAQRIVSDIVT